MKRLLSLAWPVIISRSAQVVVGMADALMVTHLGETAMAATTAGSMNAVAAFIFPMGIVFIVSSFSAQLAGRGDLVSARRYGFYGLGVAALAQVLVFAILPFLPWMLSLLSYAPDVQSGMNDYLTIRLMSTGFVVGVEALGNYYGGLGDTQKAMHGNMIAMIANVFFNWLLIDGHWGFAAHGVKGAAAASVAATFCGLLYLVFRFVRDGRGMPKPDLHRLEFRRMMGFGLPLGMNWAIEFYAWILYLNIVVAGLGTTSLAAMMAVMQINSVSFMPAFGLASAGAILVGQTIGEGKKDDVPGWVRLTFLTNLGWMGLVSLSYLAVPSLLLGPFVPAGSDGQFLKVGVVMLMISAAWQVFDAGGMTLSESLRSTGDTSYPMWARVIIAWGIFLPGSWISVRILGGGAVTATFWLVIYLALLSLVLFYRFRSGAWRRIDLVPESLPV